MRRADLAVARVVSESKAEPRAYVDLAQPLLDAHDVGKLLGGISESQVDQLRESAGLPASEQPAAV